MNGARFYAPHVTPEIMQFFGLRAAYPLHRKTKILAVDILTDRNIFQQINQRRSFIPIKVFTAAHHHITEQGRHRYKINMMHIQSFSKCGKIFANRIKYRLRIIDQVHFIDRHNKMRNTYQTGQIRMPA